MTVKSKQPQTDESLRAVLMKRCDITSCFAGRGARVYAPRFPWRSQLLERRFDLISRAGISIGAAFGGLGTCPRSSGALESPAMLDLVPWVALPGVPSCVGVPQRAHTLSDPGQILALLMAVWAALPPALSCFAFCSFKVQIRI